MRILLFGGSGQVGLALQRRWPGEISAPTRAEINLLDPDAVTRAVLASDADVVINAAAYTDVDNAEREREIAHRINAVVPGVMALSCSRAGKPLIHLSTDYVFDGCGQGPLDELAPTNPLNVYGATKLIGERSVRAGTERYVTIRLASLFGPDGTNFLKTMLRLLRTQDVVRVVADQVSCPTPAVAVADMLCRIVPQLMSASFDRWGTYHFAGTPPTTWYDFARAIRDAAERRGVAGATLEPTKLRSFARPAIRPLRTPLDCKKIEATFGVERPSWEDSLPTILQHLIP